jgi:hypothetical protein
MALENTLAYFDTATIMTVKSFKEMPQGPVLITAIISGFL